MNIETLRQVHQAEPFRAFTLHMIDGRALHVPQRELLSHSPGGKTVIVYHDDDDFSLIDLAAVSELEVHGPSPPGPYGMQ